MTDLKKRVDRIEARIGARDETPRTFAGFVKWETQRRDANGGRLTPAESVRIRAAWEKFIDGARPMTSPRADR